MRITAGRFKGRAITAPEGQTLRPTSDKVRQAIFNVLEHHDFENGFALEGVRVIDLFAGTGALGLEALSRGAAYALLIDNAAESRAFIRRNVEAMGLTGITKIWRREATDLGKNAGEPFGLAFLDPPYRKGLIAPALKSLHEGNWLSSDALIVVETAADEDIPSTDEYEVFDERTYGETRIVFLLLAREDG
jgi:16S rRNA (guanine966-N2)-methyltransferase